MHVNNIKIVYNIDNLRRLLSNIWEDVSVNFEPLARWPSSNISSPMCKINSLLIQNFIAVWPIVLSRACREENIFPRLTV